MKRPKNMICCSKTANFVVSRNESQIFSVLLKVIGKQDHSKTKQEKKSGSARDQREDMLLMDAAGDELLRIRLLCFVWWSWNCAVVVFRNARADVPWFLRVMEIPSRSRKNAMSCNTVSLKRVNRETFRTWTGGDDAFFSSNVSRLVSIPNLPNATFTVKVGCELVLNRPLPWLHYSFFCSN